MRLTTIVLSLLLCGSTMGLLFWQASHVSRRVVRVDSNGLILEEDSGWISSRVRDVSGADDSVTGRTLAAAEEWENADAREPLFPPDSSLRRDMNSMLSDATRRLPEILARDALTPDWGMGSGDPDADSKVHWAFRRLRTVKVPDVDGASHPIDAFVLRQLAAHELQPNRSADPRTLIRRLSYDLRGLPPDPQTVQQYGPLLADTQSAAEAWRELIEQYLADPAYGEHWARMWLDVARYADSNGYELDDFRPNAYPYRDFVIWAFQVDLPYDRFVQWQVAGDELHPDFAPAIAATGFLAAAPHNTFMPQPVERYDELHDMISTLGAGMLGLSVGCARCHDHFYDPITMREYYGLVAVLESAERTTQYLQADPSAGSYSEIAAPLVQCEERLNELQVARIRADKIARLDFTPEEKELLLQPVDPDNERQQELLARCGGCLRADGSDFTPDLQPLPEHRSEWEQLQSEIEQLKATLPMAPPEALIITGSDARTTFIQQGGVLERRGSEVGPGFLTALTEPSLDWQAGDWTRWLPADLQSEPQRPRTALARWLTDLDHGAGPLLARVIVNRIWQQYFGRGLASDANDLGMQSDPPSHPELLEWLATELVRSGWSIRHVQRLIVTSAAYRQSSRIDPQQAQLDPENRWLGRFPQRRLTAEMYRDSVLQVTGSLNREMYGPSVFPPIPPDAIYTDDYELDTKWPSDVQEGPEVWRRTVYTALRRSNTIPLLDVLDGPDGGKCRGRRVHTTTPVQMLALLNSPFLVDQASRMAAWMSEYSVDLEDQTMLLYWQLFQRPPTVEELNDVYTYIERRRAAEEIYDVDVMAELCHALMISNEFLYID